MSETTARLHLTRLAWVLASSAFALIVVAGMLLERDHSVTFAASRGPIGSLHVAAAAIAGATVLALVAVAWLRMPDDRRVVASAGAALALLLVQSAALIGASGAPQPVWAASYLGATALMLALGIFISVPVVPPALVVVRGGWAGIVCASVAVTFGVLVSGAWLAAGDSTTSCTDWPLCDNSLAAVNVATFDAQVVHRVLVAAMAALLTALAAATFTDGRPSRQRSVILGSLLCIFAAEIVVGAFSAIGGDAALVSAAHFGIAGITWSLLVGLALVAPATDVVVAIRDRTAPSWPAVARDYARVTKPGIMLLLLTTTLGAMLVAADGWPSLSLIVATLLGGALASGGASALNCYFDRDIDVVMARTRKRPLPTGRLTARQVLGFGLLLSLLAILELALLVNPVAAGLALAGNLFYVVVYTLWLKRSTPQNIVIGGAAGAFPPLVGWAAVTGSVSLAALLLFAVIYYWTPPHFWSLALLKARDYERAAIPMMPVTHGEQHTRRLILLYALQLVGVTVMLVPAGGAGLLYLGAAGLLGAAFVGYAARMYLERTSRLAWRLFKYSNYYLALLLLALVLDHAFAG